MSLSLQAQPDTRSDSLGVYRRAAHAVQLLEADEERRLIGRAQKGDRLALEHLILAYTPLVLKQVRRMARSYRAAPSDLMQEGMLGLMEAVRRFDATKGARLSTYAIWWIRALLLRSVLLNWRLVRVGTTKAHRAAFFDLQKERRLQERDGQVADLGVLSARIGVSESELGELERHLHTPEASLDAPEGPAGLTLADGLFADDASRPDAQAEHHEQREHLASLVNEFSSGLQPREREVVRRRWLVEEPLPLRELATSFGVSTERARQIEAALLQRFHRFARVRLADSEEPQLSRVA